MRKFFRAVATFWALAGTGAGIIGGYLAAEAADSVVAFWIVIVCAASLAVLLWLGPSILSALQKVQRHDKLLQRVGLLQAEVESLKESLASARSDATSARDEGVAEGERRVIGSLTAAQSPVPVLVGIAEVANEVVVLAVRRGDKPAIGSRYVLRSTNTGHARGIVELVSWQSDDMAVLRCVDAISPRYWDALANRVLENDAAPTDTELEPLSLNFDAHRQPEVASPQFQIQQDNEKETDV